MTEVGLLKTAVTRFMAEQGKTGEGKPENPKSWKWAQSVQSIAKSNPIAVEEFKAKYGDLHEGFAAALAFTKPTIKVVESVKEKQ